jgi:signal transduction histidine kinase
MLELATLINLLGFTVGIVLYGLLLVMVVWYRSEGQRSLDKLLVVTGALGLLWNSGEFLLFLSRDIGAAAVPPMMTAVSYAALGFLPSVVVHSAWKSHEAENAFLKALTFLAYGFSITASVLHFLSALQGDVPSAAALRLLTVGSIVLLAGLVGLSFRRKLERKAVWASALLVFAVSALHLSSHDEARSWLIEGTAHQSSLPLAFAILLSNFRFAFADLFLKRALSVLLLAGFAFLLYVYAAVPMLGWHETHDRNDVQAAVIVIALWMLTAFAYPLIHRFSVWFVDSVLLRRADYSELESDVTAAVGNADDEETVLDAVSRMLGAALTAREYAWALSEDSGARPGRPAVASSARTATVRVPTVEGPYYDIVLKDFTGGRRLLSDELRMLEEVSLLVARRIDGIRVAHERFDMEIRGEKLAKFATEAQLSALRAQVNPHFLFNALTTIGYLIKSSPDKAFATLMKLTSLLRGVLRSSGEFCSLEEEIRLIEDYLDIEKARFEERLQVVIDVSEELRRTRIPTLLLQPLVENAVKHGISHVEAGGRVEISARRENGSLVLSVSDTGAGFAAVDSDGAGLGLDNIRQRLESYYGADATLSSSSEAGKGTTAEVVIPE